MNNATGFERLSELQDEILRFTWAQLGDKVEKFYIQGKITDDENGNVTSVEGNFRNAVKDGAVLDASDIVNDEDFVENARFIKPRITEMHDLLISLQGKSPVRFRWAVDTKTGQVDSEWTYYDDLTDDEKHDDWWKYWDADFAWRDQLQAELDAR